MKKGTPYYLTEGKWKKNKPTWAILFTQSFISTAPFETTSLVHSNSSPNTKTRAVLWVSLEFLTPNAHESPSSEIKPIVWSKYFMYTKTRAVSWVSREYLTLTFIDQYPYTLFLLHHNWGNFWDSCVHIFLLLWGVCGDNVPARLSQSPSNSSQTFLAFTNLWIQTCMH